MKRTAVFLTLFVLAPGLGLWGQEEKGNRAYRRGEYAEALKRYREALTVDSEPARLQYNLGTTLLQLGEFLEARESLAEGLGAQAPDLRSRAFYNLGNSLAGGSGGDSADEEELRAGVEAYRRALLLDPRRDEARWNMELALRRLDELEQDTQSGSGPEQQQPTAAPQGEGSGAEQDPPGAGEQPLQPQPGGVPPRESTSSDLIDEPLTRELADQILRAVEERERDLQREKLRRQRQRVKGPDW